MTTVVDQQTAVATPTHEGKPTARRVRTHQGLAVVCALVCFRPLGVAAVVCAGNVRTQLALGDLEGARRASRRALWLGCASASVTLFFLLVVVVGAHSYSNVH